MDLVFNVWFQEGGAMSSGGLNLTSTISGLFYLLFVFILTLALLSLGISVGQKWRYEAAKLTAFECGFDPLSSSRMPFSMRFFLVALLFLVFDMEMVLLFPYIFSLKIMFLEMGLYSKVMCFLFLMVLLGGLVHEVNEGSLEWKL
uniref:NADH-ubiquinone oxidoreductase chain 3 n=1 Tax=Saxidomus purpurata TaxID=311201 RepID=A0A0D4CFW8_9BIVA|nr:NADH dehydrogenase subunit 3 [Saxidomus purpurata]AJT47994.1 NADH dehydrogenase subunit 3 [Saxidomus purpurata]